MKAILRTSSISLAESLRVALEAEGISAFVSNANLGGLPPAAITVAVADDADYDQGLVVLNELQRPTLDRKSTRLNSSHSQISYAVFCLKKKKKKHKPILGQDKVHADTRVVTSPRAVTRRC